MIRLEKLSANALEAYGQIRTELPGYRDFPGMRIHPRMAHLGPAIENVIAYLVDRQIVLVADTISPGNVLKAMVHEGEEAEAETDPFKRVLEHGDSLFFALTSAILHTPYLHTVSRNRIGGVIEYTTASIEQAGYDVNHIMVDHVGPKDSIHYPAVGYDIVPHELTRDMPARSMQIARNYRMLRPILAVYKELEESRVDITDFIAAAWHGLTDQQVNAATALGYPEPAQASASLY